MSSNKFIRSKIEEVEQEFNLDFGKIHILRSEYRTSAAVLKIGRGKYRIELPLGYGRRRLLEDLYHELGHIYRWRNGLTKSKEKIFRSGTRAGFSKEEIKNFRRHDRPLGHASSYAMTNSDEDWAETFSCYLVNRKLSGYIEYEDEKINLNSDAKLKAKMKTIQSLLRSHRPKVHS